jgi:hypothetical protein
MTAIVTTPFRVVNAENFKEDIAGSSVYVGIGKTDVWSTVTSDLTDATTPFTPTDRIDDIHEAYQNLIGMKKIASADVAHIVPRHTWDAGTTYDAWDSDDSAIYDKFFYIITSEYKVYKCISSPGTQSLVEPTHINTDPTAESDTYKWKYMYTLTVTDSEKFLTISYMPVRTEQTTSTSVGGNGNSSSTTVTLTAANEYIVVGMLVTGSGITAGDTVAAIDGVTLTLSSARAVANSTTLTFGVLAETDVNFTNQTAQRNSANTSLTAVAGIERYEVTADGSGYTSAPDVIVRGDGTNASATATVSGGILTSVVVTTGTAAQIEANRGDGYTVADLLIGSVTGGGGTGAAARAVITPPGGHGIDPVKELGAFYVAVNTQLSGSEGGDLTVGNDFRQITLIKKPQNFGTEVTATATTLRARKSLVLAAGQSVSGFAVDQVLVGGTSAAKAYLVEIDTTNKVLYYVQNSKTGYGNFVQGDAITGTLPSGGSATLDQGSGTSWYGQAVNGYGPEVKMNSGQLLFLENRAPINRSSSQIEDIKLIIEF